MNTNGMVDRKGWLVPYDGERSFYGKARVVEMDNGALMLLSYHTPVAVWKDGKLYRTWLGWSATTARHVKSFCMWLNHPVPNKKAWEGMEVFSRYELEV